MCHPEVRDGYHDNPLRGIGIRFEMPEFSGKDHAKKQRDLAGKSKVVTWENMKHLLKAKFLCDNHKQEAFLDDHNFFQRALTIEELVNEFDRLRMRFDATEEEEQVIAQFLGCIRPDISDVGDGADLEIKKGVVYADRGEALVTQRVLNIAVSQSIDNNSWLCNNIFRTKCTSKVKLCNKIIDGVVVITWFQS
ncbi:reverse transcriptase domain-containing protein [Artemisia annua]|uniref:Reverse transcriptase domain-containing protein n=1 Tax=Artemisia annua TaxID=35608 RepID=A0A2U1PAM9_ARTAN|nr:reverse transcriptase domain-containing protein [Artemisia annua]